MELLPPIQHTHTHTQIYQQISCSFIAADVVYMLRM